ncbi:sigma-54-dependent Fis family transcriptional regulator [Pseudoclavibacter soli]|uniref:sigma-54-dependent Fis family transcriptional regulator n=1 Tax=Pseudoclavibacter soli TaxID=452623 RepID=UPI0004230477|nr:helix-turn-helix domain-containing protein [Pseudoclavibacter soli]
MHSVDDVARARERFIRATRQDSAPANQNTHAADPTTWTTGVPLPIAGSWQRSVRAGVDAESSDSRRVTVTDDTLLSRCATEPMNELVHQLGSLDVSVVLSDDNSHVLARADNGHTAQALVNHIDLAPGFDFSEGFVGTNGVGTVIETRRPIYVAGAAHYQERFLRYVCAGAPIIHPITGRLEGVLDLTCDIRDASPMMQVIAVQGARAVEHELFQASSSAERRVFEAFTRARAEAHGQPGLAVIAATPLLTLRNVTARRLLDEGATAKLVEQVRRSLAASNATETSVVLSAAAGRLAAQVSAARINGVADGVLIWARRMPQIADRPARPARHSPRRPSASPEPESLHVVDELTLGRQSQSSTWALARRDLTRSLRRFETTLVLGEIGTGKVSLVNEVARAEGWHTHTIAPETVTRAGGFAQALAVCEADADVPGDATPTSRQSAPVLVLRNAHRLPQSTLAEVTQWLRAPRLHGQPVRVVLTAENDQISDGQPIATALPMVAHTVTLPALRQRRADFSSLVTSILEALQPGSSRRLAPEALRTLAEGHWPGNIHQLTDALRHALRQRPVGEITTADLPPHAFSAALRHLTEAERQQRAAIMTALYRAGGNRAAAARALDISRSTLYRRLAEYGLSETD